MSQVTVTIGGRHFDVVCQEGEEEFLLAAAELLDEEAQKIDTTGTRIPESRLLLMAGLLLADRTAALQDQLDQGAGGAEPSKTDENLTSQTRALEAETKLRTAEIEVASLQGRIAELEDRLDRTTQDAQEAIEGAEKERDDALGALEKVVEKITKLAADGTEENA